MREPRLGDDIDDFCVRCKRVMNHSVVSVVNAQPAKVRCRTCHNDHDFRHEQPPPPKVDPKKAALFTEVLKKVDPDEATEAETGVELEAVAADDPPEAAPPEVAAPDKPAKPKAKAAKAKGKSK